MEFLKKDGTCYRLVGECFVGGLVGGAVVNAMKEERNHRGPFSPRRLFDKLINTLLLRRRVKK